MTSDDIGRVPSNTPAFEEITTIIDRSRERMFRSVNRALIDMYWEIRRCISEKTKTDKWGKSIVKEFSMVIQSRYNGMKGFSPQNIWRMKRFYETYAGNEKLSTLLKEISWTNNFAIMSRAKTEEAREFYLEELDRDVREPNENPSVGLILCASKDDEVAEYALNRSMSSALIAEYQTRLPQKALLENELCELRELAGAEGLSDVENDGGEGE
jgi:predicted nuclease of restriction endonuclease-like (RecB) superfamily